jgi:hypothetical protein
MNADQKKIEFGWLALSGFICVHPRLSVAIFLSSLRLRASAVKKPPVLNFV